jgi:hypothetical protein
LGTASDLETRGASLAFFERLIESDNSWREAISADTIPPEPFVVELRQRADMFNGDYFLIFDTVDKQTGVDHFEVLELRPGQRYGEQADLSWWDKLWGKEYTVPVWQQATINYRLQDQTLNSTIRVKALDKAGNERMVEFIPPPEVREKMEETTKSRENMLLLTVGAVALLILLLIVVVYLVVKRKRRLTHAYNNHKSDDEDI